MSVSLCQIPSASQLPHLSTSAKAGHVLLHSRQRPLHSRGVKAEQLGASTPASTATRLGPLDTGPANSQTAQSYCPVRCARSLSSHRRGSPGGNQIRPAFQKAWCWGPLPPTPCPTEPGWPPLEIAQAEAGARPRIHVAVGK